jgi:hypothetical protein
MMRNTNFVYVTFIEPSEWKVEESIHFNYKTIIKH